MSSSLHSSPAPHILVVDDNPQDRRLVIRELQKAFHKVVITEARDLVEFESAVQAGNLDLVITDYQLKWTDGLKVLLKIKAAWPLCPVIMFTATGGEEVAVEAMKHGLDDYIIKNVKHLIRIRGAANAALKNAQMRLRAEELAFRLESLLAELEVGVFRCAVDGRLLEVNTIMRQLIDRAEIDRDEEATLASLFDDPAKAQAFLQQVLASDEAVEVEFAAPSDPSKFFRLSARALEPENKPRHIEGLVEEVTHRKQIEETSRQAAAAAAKLEMLTTRERDVVRELVRGSANKVIARRLDISEKTVEKHRASLMRKLHAKSLAEVVRLALLAEPLPESARD